MSENDRIVFGGVDTHRDTHVAAVVDTTGRLLGSATFGADTTGYEQLGDWLGSWGQVAQVGIEGTGSYGAGLARYLNSVGVIVVEVNRPNRQLRRRFGKTDATDAEAAARAVLSGQATGTPKSGEGPVEAIRVLSVARRSAVKETWECPLRRMSCWVVDRLFHLVTNEGTTRPINRRSAAFQM